MTCAWPRRDRHRSVRLRQRAGAPDGSTIIETMLPAELSGSEPRRTMLPDARAQLIRLVAHIADTAASEERSATRPAPCEPTE